MSIFATVALVCFVNVHDNVQCDDYFLDEPQNVWSMAEINTQNHLKEYQQAFDSLNMQDLPAWLEKYEIYPTVNNIVSLDISTQEVNDEMIP